MNYRYLPAQNGAVTHTETVVRRSLPTAVVTYTGTNHHNANQLQQSGGGGFAAAQTIGNHVAETSTSQVLHTGRDVAYHENGDVTRDVTVQNGDVRRGVTRQTSAGTSPRESGIVRGNLTQQALQQQQHAEYSTVTRPVVTSSTAYVAGVTEGARESRLIADHSTDTRFTNEGRLIADAEYLATTEVRSHCPAPQLPTWPPGKSRQCHLA